MKNLSQEPEQNIPVIESEENEGCEVLTKLELTFKFLLQNFSF